MATDAVTRVKALGDLQAILASFAFRQGVMADTVVFCLGQMPMPHIKGFQLALVGAGHCTPNFDADGVVGQETLASLVLLYKAAGLLEGDGDNKLSPLAQVLFDQFSEGLKAMSADEVPVDSMFRRYLVQCPEPDKKELATLMHTAAFEHRGYGRIGGTLEQFLEVILR